LSRPADREAVVLAASGLGAALFMLACNATARLGDAAIVFRHVVGIVFVSGALLFLARHVLAPGRLAALGRAALSALPFAAVFVVIGGAGSLASHGRMFAIMAGDFWHGDPYFAFTRRPAVSAIAHVFGFSQSSYIFFWYALFFACLCVLQRLLAERGLSFWERLSILTSSIAAYLLIVPGYNEAFVFFCAAACWRHRLSLAEKLLVGALMLGAHEVATVFAAAFLIGEAEPQDRRGWLAAFGFLYAAYVLGYAINWGFDVQAGLTLAVKPTPKEAASSLQWVVQQKLRFVGGMLIAYKLLWLLVARAATTDRRQRYRVVCILATLPLTLVATDTSRLVQFGSLSFILLAADMLQHVRPVFRRLLVWANLAMPSLYIATNNVPAVGKGLYLLSVVAYMKAAPWLGLPAQFAIANPGG
jgi:hypothetical protein